MQALFHDNLNNQYEMKECRANYMLPGKQLDVVAAQSMKNSDALNLFQAEIDSKHVSEYFARNACERSIPSLKVDSQRTHKQALAELHAIENMSMHAYATDGNNSLDKSVWQHHPAAVNNQLDEQEVELPVVTNVRGKRASIDVVTEGNLTSIAPSEVPSYTWSSRQRTEHSGYRIQPPAQSRKITDSNYGPFESPYRPPVIPPSKRVLSPAKYQHLRLGALSPATEKSDIDVDLVGEDRYDPQSRAFSYVPAQSLVEHFRSPKKPTKVIPTYEYTHGYDSSATPQAADDRVQSLETPTDADQPTALQQPNFDDLCNPNFYLNFGGSAEEPILSTHTEFSAIPRSWSAPAAVFPKATKATLLNNLPTSPPRQSMVSDFYKRQNSYLPQEIDQEAVDRHLAPSSRSYQEAQLNKAFAESVANNHLQELTKTSVAASVQHPLRIYQRSSPFLSPEDHFPLDTYENHYSKRSETAQSLLSASNGSFITGQQRAARIECSCSQLNFVLFTVLRIEFSIASRAVQPFIPRDVVQPSEPFCLCMERTKDSNTQRLFSPTEREMRSPTHYAVAEDDHLLQNAFERRLYMADQRDQSSGSVYGSLPSDWSVSSATNAESWLDKQMQKLKLRQELTDPHLKKRREQERLLLEELKQVHEDRVARHNRQESDYTVEGIGSKSGASGDDEHSLYAVVSKISTPMGNDKTFYKMETKPAEVESPDLSPLHVNDARMVLSPVDYPTASLLQNGINNSNRYPRAVELQNVDRSTTKSLSSPKSILKKSKPVGAQLLSSPVVDDTRPEEQGILSGQLNDSRYNMAALQLQSYFSGSNLSRNYASPSSLCSRPNKVAILLHYTSKRLSLQMRPETPSFPLRRTETPLPYHPLLYSDAAGAEVSQNRIANRVGPGCIHSGSIRSQSPASHYYAHSVRSSLTSLLGSASWTCWWAMDSVSIDRVNFYVKLHTPPPGVDLNCDVNHSEPMEVVHHHPVFVKDTSKFWYKPSISREEAISVLKDKQPGAFIIRDSNSFPGAFGLALKVAIPPPGVQTKSNDRSELVRHFLIETTAKGVKLKGCNNEPIFGSLAALVYQHSMTPLALPCKLLLPEYDPALSVEQITTAQQLLDQGAACNVTYLFSNETESLTGPEAVRRTVDVTLTTASTKELDPIVSSQGITITDNARKKFFRRHYPVPTITHCSVDPENRQWSVAGSVPAMIFGFVARKSVAKSENVCHVFAELEPEQPASAIVNFISRVILAPSHTVSTD
ncbi:hypothetical protein M514_01015 [Trichuris suis]|uniref:SH2 domain-containing protein n=1 Tax=Trichuris suis TaxID=68888 RepID=A0A085NM22_9BILA|nr:hypothetical protein M514_01015 [Trichuris suis]